MELTTEEKIIAAARTVFTKKGFSSTRTRDISEEAGINLALLNYYFGSKEKLFRLIIKEEFEQLFGMITPILSDAHVTIEEKIETLVNNYTKLLLKNEDLPMFVLNELKSNKDIFESILQNARLLSQPIIEIQLKERGFTISTINFIMNIVSMTLFPFLSKPLFVSSGLLKEEEFTSFVMDRKQQIPAWIMSTLK